MTSLSKDESENYAEAGGVAEEVLSSVRTVVAFGGQEKEVSMDSLSGQGVSTLTSDRMRVLTKNCYCATHTPTLN